MSQVDDTAVSTFLKKQQIVKSWIEEVLQVKLGDELLAALKNGIVLCYLMVEIEPRAIPSIQVKLNIAHLLYLFTHLLSCPAGGNHSRIQAQGECFILSGCMPRFRNGKV
jgi:hypothetical protein